jgi:restriction system protein
MARKKKKGGVAGPLVLVVASSMWVWTQHPFLGAVSLGVVGFAAFWWLTRKRRAARRELELLEGRRRLVEATGHMSGPEFERVLAVFFRRAGYAADVTGRSGDQGMDLMLRKDGRKVAVQAKRYAKPVGNRAVQEALAARQFHRTDDAWVVTTSSFTPGAAELASRANVRLIDGAELAAWMSETEKTKPRAPAAGSVREARKRAMWHPHPDD